ncbi:MAG: glycosyltransferase family 2 protein [Nitrosomonadales bacterium]|nr:glycosyltransferase family 2 protein [Nitrosomonadales bacterium]
MDVSIILVSYNTINMTKEALAYLYASEGNVKFEVFIIDNASRDGSAAVLREQYPHIHLIENNQNVGFGRANNQALPFISGRYVLLLNTDAFVDPSTLRKTFDYMEAHPAAGILGVKLLGRDKELQPSCRYFPTPWNLFLSQSGLSRFFAKTKMIDDAFWNPEIEASCDWVPGCYYLVRREVIDQVGLFDPRYFLYYEEVDHCFAAKHAGWDVVYFPGTSVIHIGGESAKSDGKLSSGRQLQPLQIESELLYFRKNHGLACVLLNVLLTTLADMIRMTKDVLKLKGPNGYFLHFRHSLLLWGLFFKTKMGAKPTR